MKLRVWRFCKASAFYIGAGAASNSQIFIHGPVFQVMATLKTRFCGIGNLIMNISCFSEPGDGFMIHLPVQLIRNLINDSVPEHSIKWCVFFNLQTVKRQMFGRKFQCPLQSIFPAVHSMPRHSKHQIQIDIGKSHLPCQRKVFHKLFSRMNSSQCFQNTVVQRLNPYRKPVNSKRSVIPQFLFRQCSGIGFDGDFCISVYMKAFPKTFANPSDKSRIRQRRCSSPNKYSIDLVISPIPLPVCRNVADKFLYVSLLLEGGAVAL